MESNGTCAGPSVDRISSEDQPVVFFTGSSRVRRVENQERETINHIEIMMIQQLNNQYRINVVITTIMNQFGLLAYFPTNQRFTLTRPCGDGMVWS